MSTQREGTHHARRQLELDLILSTPPTRRKGAPHARRQLELDLILSTPPPAGKEHPMRGDSWS